MNATKTMRTIMLLAMLVMTCLLLSGCFITNGEHFLWF